MSDYTKGYTPTDWQDGDVITEERVDHLEEGVSDAHAWLADLEASIPTDTANLTNGAGFLTAVEVQAMIDAALEPESSDGLESL